VSFRSLSSFRVPVARRCFAENERAIDPSIASFDRIMVVLFGDTVTRSFFLARNLCAVYQFPVGARDRVPGNVDFVIARAN